MLTDVVIVLHMIVDLILKGADPTISPRHLELAPIAQFLSLIRDWVLTLFYGR